MKHFGKIVAFLWLLCFSATAVAQFSPNQVLTAAELNAALTANNSVVATGSTASRTLPNRFAERLSVLDFGALPNGTTSANDSTVAFTKAQAAAAAAGGGTVYVPPGAYWLSSSLPQTAGVSWETQPGVTFPGPFMPPGFFYQYPFANNGEVTPHAWGALLNNEEQAGDATAAFQFHGVQNGSGSSNSAVVMGSFMHIANPYVGAGSPAFVNTTLSSTFDATGVISPGGLWGEVVKSWIGNPYSVGTIDIGSYSAEFDMQNYGSNLKAGGKPKYGIIQVAEGSVDSDFALYPQAYGGARWNTAMVYDAGDLRSYAWLGLPTGGTSGAYGAFSWMDTSGNALFNTLQLGSATGSYASGFTAVGPVIKYAATSPSGSGNAGSIAIVGGQTGSPTGAAYINTSAGSGSTWHQIATQNDAATFSNVTATNAVNANIIAGSRNTLDDGAGNLTMTGTLTGVYENLTGAFSTTSSITGKTLSLNVPGYVVATTYTVGVTDSALIFNPTGAMTVTLPSAATYPGRELTIKNTSAYAVTSASSNVVPITGVTPASAMIAAGPGKWVMMRSDGTNWQVMMSN